MIGRWTAPLEDTASQQPKGFDDFDLRLGDIMRGERATMGKSLLDVQRELKIKANYIAAIENSDPTAFETPGFIAGYVRSYARYLNLDPEWAYRTFCDEGDFAVAHGMSAAASGARTTSARVDAAKSAGLKKDPFEQPDTPFIPSGGGLLSRIEPGAVGSSLVLIALIGAIGYGGWSVLQEVQRVQFAPIDQTPGVTAQVDPLAPAESFAAGTTNDTALSAPAPEALARLYRPQALDVPVLSAPRDAPIATLDPDSVASVIEAEAAPAFRDVAALAAPAPTPATDPDAPPVQVVAADPAEVVMFAVRPSWVRVRAADGTVLFEKILDTGERYTLPKTEEPPRLRAGNAGSIYFSVGGQTYGPAGSGPSVIKNVPIGPGDVTTAYAVADLTKDRDLARIVASVAAQ